MLNLIAKVKTMNAGWDSEKKDMADKGFSIGDIFEVIEIDMGGFSTYIKLDSVQGSFNSVFFEFYDAITNELVDIYSDERFQERYRAKYM